MHANWSIYTHIQQPAEGVLLHSALLLCILTLWWQVLVQETIELLHSWQPAHHRERERKRRGICYYVCERSKKKDFPNLFFLPGFAHIQRWQLRGLKKKQETSFWNSRNGERVNELECHWGKERQIKKKDLERCGATPCSQLFQLKMRLKRLFSASLWFPQFATWLLTSTKMRWALLFFAPATQYKPRLPNWILWPQFNMFGGFWQCIFSKSVCFLGESMYK